MPWNFFYDEDDSKPYESIHDWYMDTKYLIVPTIAMVVLGIGIYIYFRYFHI